jgi:hypothetical protein
MKYKKGNSDDIGIAGQKDQRKYQKHQIEIEIVYEKNNILGI